MRGESGQPRRVRFVKQVAVGIDRVHLSGDYWVLWAGERTGSKGVKSSLIRCRYQPELGQVRTHLGHAITVPMDLDGPARAYLADRLYPEITLSVPPRRPL
jgi:hypothetical protein